MDRFYKLSLYILGVVLVLAMLFAFNQFIPSWDKPQNSIVSCLSLLAVIISVYWIVAFIRRQKKAAAGKGLNWAKVILLPLLVLAVTGGVTFFSMLGIALKDGFLSETRFCNEVYYEKQDITLFLYEETGFMDQPYYEVWKRDGFLPTRSKLFQTRTGGIDSVAVDGKTLRFTITFEPEAMLIRLP